MLLNIANLKPPDANFFRIQNSLRPFRCPKSGRHADIAYRHVIFISRIYSYPLLMTVEIILNRPFGFIKLDA